VIAFSLLAAQAMQLWPSSATSLQLDYRIQIEGDARIVRDQRLNYRVKRTYEGSIRLDRREDQPTWDFNFDTGQTNPTLLQTTAAKIRIQDDLRLGAEPVQTWRADHAARRVMTEATIELAPSGKSYRLEFATGDTLGATDAVDVTEWSSGVKQSSTLGLTQLPNFGTINNEFRAGVVMLPQLGRAEFIKSWPVTSFTAIAGIIENPSIKVILTVRIHIPRSGTAD